jgi:hypothetical protein
MANEIGNTELSATKQTLITEIAQRALYASSVFMPSFRNLSAYAGKGMKSISFPKNTSLFTVENRASEAAGTNQQIAFGVDTLNLDNNAHIQWVVDSYDEIQSSLNVQQELIVRASAAHGADFDANAITKMEAAGIVTTTAGDISQDIVLEMRKVLLTNKAMPSNLWLAVSPAQEAKLLKIDPFVSAQQYGSAIVPQGVLGTIYGVKVLVSPQLAGQQYFMYESEGFGFALQRGPSYDEAPKPEFGVGALLSVLAQLYGQKALQVAVPGAFKADGTTALGAAESALIVKDNN